MARKHLRKHSKGIDLYYYSRLISISMTAALVLGGIITYYTLVLPAASSADQQIGKNMIEQISNSARAQIQLWTRMIHGFSRQASLIDALRSGNDEQLTRIEKDLRSTFPHTLSIDIITQQALNNEQQTTQQIGFAAFEMVHSAAAQKRRAPEIHFINTQKERLVMVEPVVDPQTKQTLAVMLLMIDAKLVREIFNFFQPTQGSFALLQQVDEGQAKTITTFGAAKPGSARPEQSRAIAGTHWTLAYWPAQHHLLMVTKSRFAFIVALLIALIAALSAVWFLFNKLNILLDRDLQVLAEEGQFLQQNRFTAQRFALQLVRKWFTPSGVDNMTEGTQAPVDAVDNSNEAFTQAPPSVDPLFNSDGHMGMEVIEQNASDIPQEIFRAYDIRGIVGETLTADIVQQIGLAIGSEAKAQGVLHLVIGRDGRLSSPDLAQALRDGLLASGIDVTDVGCVPTPVLYFATYHLQSYSGVMLTGSHNPAQYNGLKMMLNKKTLCLAAIQDLYNRASNQQLIHGRGQYKTSDVTNPYIKAVQDSVTLGRPLKIVVDAGNGVAGPIACQVFDALGCTVLPLYCDIDGHFPHHHPDPSDPDNLQDLIAMVKAEQADIGIAFDGDGDRLGVVTDQGEIIWPDRQMMLFSSDVIAHNPGCDVIFDVKCTKHLATLIRKQGGEPIMFKTGHSLIKSKLQEIDAKLAGELSGHIFFNDRWYGFDDAIYAAARLLEIISNDIEQRNASMLFAAYPDSVNTPEIKIAIDPADKFTFMEKLSKQADFAGGDVLRIDGLRVDFGDGWGLIRPSNTTPNLIARFEADDEQSLKRIQAVFKAQIHNIDAGLKLPF